MLFKLHGAFHSPKGRVNPIGVQQSPPHHDLNCNKKVYGGCSTAIDAGEFPRRGYTRRQDMFGLKMAPR